jgi:hypothetical protein
MPFFEPPENNLDRYQLEVLASVFQQTWSEIVPKNYPLPRSQKQRLQKEVSERLCALATKGMLDPEMLQAMTVATVRLPPRTSRRAALIARRLSSNKSPEEFVIEERNGEIVVSSAGFRAVYLKSSNQSRIVLKGRSQTDDYRLLTRAWRAANDKARELGWIV